MIGGYRVERGRHVRLPIQFNWRPLLEVRCPFAGGRICHVSVRFVWRRAVMVPKFQCVCVGDHRVGRDAIKAAELLGAAGGCRSLVAALQRRWWSYHFHSNPQNYGHADMVLAGAVKDLAITITAARVNSGRDLAKEQVISVLPIPGRRMVFRVFIEEWMGLAPHSMGMWTNTVRTP